MNIKIIVVLMISLVWSASKSNAQATQENATGYPVISKTFVDVEGSPYLYSDFMKGSVTLENGSTYNDMLLKYNQVDDVLYFKGKNEEVLSFVQPVSAFSIANYSKDGKSNIKQFRNKYPAVSRYTDKSFYEVLADGKVQLLKKTDKHITENKAYNSATVVKNVNEDVKYFMYFGGKMNQVKRDKKTVLALLADKQQPLEDYLKENNINFKADADLAKLINYYNSL